MEQRSRIRVDHSALRTNQGVIIAVLACAYITELPVLAFICGSLMLLGSMNGKPAFLPIYHLLRSIGLVQPDLQVDRSEPHRFAQAIGALMLFAASIAFIIAGDVIGWVLTIVVIVLAALNLFLGFCLGCSLYFWLARLGVPGFDKEPVEDTA
jgi:hypothetical protein